MDERAQKMLDTIRKEMMDCRGAWNEAAGGHPLVVSFDLDSRSTGVEPRWSPSTEHVELITGELWTLPAAPPGLYEVVAYPEHRNTSQVLTTGRVRLADLLGAGGVYDRAHRLDCFVVEGTVTRTRLTDDHPAQQYHKFLQNLWDELVWQCLYNWPDSPKYSCAPMPALRRLDDGTFRIAFATSVCRTGAWGDSDEDEACFFAGMSDAYPHGKRQMAPNISEPIDPPATVWQRLGVEPQTLTARTLTDDPDARIPDTPF